MKNVKSWDTAAHCIKTGFPVRVVLTDGQIEDDIFCNYCRESNGKLRTKNTDSVVLNFHMYREINHLMYKSYFCYS